MNGLDFHPNLLSPEHVKEHGTLYDEYIFYSEDEDGAVASHCIMKGFSFVGKLYKWYRNGRLKCFYEKGQNRGYIRTIKFDENGNITLLVENGKTKIEKG